MHIFGRDARKRRQQETRSILVARHIFKVVIDHTAGRFDLLLQKVFEKWHRRECHVFVVVIDQIVAAVLLLNKDGVFFLLCYREYVKLIVAILVIVVAVVESYILAVRCLFR